MVPRLLLGLVLAMALTVQTVPAQEDTGGSPTFSRPLIVLFPEMPAMPSIPDMPPLPDMPPVPDMPPMPPDMPPIPNFPGAPNMPPMPNIPGGPSSLPDASNLLGALSLAAQPIPPMPRTGSDDPCAPAADDGAPGAGPGGAGPGGAPLDLSNLPPTPGALMMVLLTNNSDETQSYMVTASSRSSGDEIATSIAPFVAPGRSAIPMFMLQSDPPQPEDVDFSAELMEIPMPPCLSEDMVQAQLEFGTPWLDGSTVLVPVTNLDPIAYSVGLQAGLLQDDELVAVAMGDVSLPAGGTETASLPLAFPFDIEEAPDHSSIVPALMPFGVRPEE